MEKVYVLYNPTSGNNTGFNRCKGIDLEENFNISYEDITKINDYKAFFSKLEKDEKVIIAGGDGTLSHFADNVSGINITNPVYYYATGSGNDFLRDLGFAKGEKPVVINKYLENPPYIKTNGILHRFFNGVGGGLDAYACRECNRLHEMGKKGNYVLAAIKGILYDYKPINAQITIDGKRHDFKNVWFVSVMKGKYFGGGIMLAPDQNRDLEKLTVVVVHNIGRLRILPIIPGAFKGKHIKYTKYVKFIEGHEISVEFDRTVTIQFDGETVEDISKYTVGSNASILIEK
ncbi:MAG: diacylglycerol/lipid kinase family protein [Clostridia bacterium]